MQSANNELGDADKGQQLMKQKSQVEEGHSQGEEYLKEGIPSHQSLVQAEREEEEEDWEAIENEYQQCFFGKALSKKKRSNKVQKLRQPPPRYQVEEYPNNRLVPLGGKQAKLLCKIRKVDIQPSSQSLYKQQKILSQPDLPQSPIFSANKDEQEWQLREQEQKQVLRRFWGKRYYLFELFDQGIRLDYQSWFSVTPQAVAEHVAALFSPQDTVLDGFCGAGGDTLQLAKQCHLVIANDIDPLKIQLLNNNATVYQVQGNIVTSNRDFFDLPFHKNQRGAHSSSNGKGDVAAEQDGIPRLSAVYLSPPWGGPDYYSRASIKPDGLDPPLSKIVRKGLEMSQNLAMLLAANTDVELLAEEIGKALMEREQSLRAVDEMQEAELIGGSCSLVIEKIVFMGRLKFLLVLVGPKLTNIQHSEQLSFIYNMVSQGETQLDRVRQKQLVRRLNKSFGVTTVFNWLFQCEAWQAKAKTKGACKFEDFLIAKGVMSLQQLQGREGAEEKDSSVVGTGRKKIAKAAKISDRNALNGSCEPARQYHDKNQRSYE